MSAFERLQGGPQLRDVRRALERHEVAEAEGVLARIRAGDSASVTAREWIIVRRTVDPDRVKATMRAGKAARLAR